ncbi:sensor histidine kinase [Desulfospira joergensenii]|uniref:sensor histidine kinase n=1 Tax=Desulfospira joergensenii TaxID=53329 RepID=UPI0003B51A5A|nr:ATP-binding protein [Desulfospira joergensenii]
MKLTVYKKMMLGFGAIIGLVILSSAYVIFELNEVSTGVKTILNSNVQTQKAARQLKSIVRDENSYAEKYLISNDPTYLSLFSETGTQVNQQLTLLLSRQTSARDRALVQEMIQSHETLVRAVENQEPDPGKTQENLARLMASLDSMIQRNQFRIGEEMGEIESIIAQSVQVALALIAGSLLAATAAALIITRTLTKPIGELIRGTQEMARGNFDEIRVSSRDEIALLAEAVNDMGSRISAVNRQRARMMQQISHEIKTPLQAMQSAHDVLKASPDINEGQVRILGVVSRAVDKLNHLSRQYLDLAKIESEAIEYNLEPSNLVNIVMPVVEETRFIAESKKIDLELKHSAVPKIMADREKIAIIVSNLITNAIKYTPEKGNILVRIDPGELGARIRVQDSGIGISREEIPNVFTRFYQAGNAGQITQNGSGVGLAIVKAYTEGHGGRVHVQSMPDQGSLFQVEFPALDSPEPESENAGAFP